jgi:formylglycine-generating enzyme required for sulfatase activity
MTMVYLPASEVLIGSSEAEIDAAFDQCELDRGAGMCDRYWFEDEFPIHAEQLDPFWIDMNEVTNAKFAAFLNDQGNQTEGSVQWLDVNDESSMIEQIDGVYIPKIGFAEHPVVEVSWFGARAYCVWVGGWLPTEEKWEYAARGPDRNIYPWGSSAPDCEKSNISGCAGGTLPVGSHTNGSSWIGVQDMGGNVWEWVSNWYRRYPGSQHQDEDFGDIYKIVRGGSWYYEPYYSRSALRTLEFYPHIRSDTIGFRCVINVDD